MQKKVFPIVLLFLVVLALVFYKPAIYNADKLFMDEDENIYFVLSNKKNIEIRKVLPSGMAAGKCVIKRFDYNSQISLADMTVAGNKAYCAFMEINALSYGVTRQLWLELDFETGKSSIIFEKSYFDEKSFIGTTIAEQNNLVKSASYYSDGVEFNVINVKTGKLIDTYNISSEYARDINGAEFYKDGGVILTNRLGNVFMSKGQSLELIYDKSCEFSQFMGDSYGGIYFYFKSDEQWKEGEIKDGALELATVDIELDNMQGGFILDKNRYAKIFEDGTRIYLNNSFKLMATPTASKLTDTIFFISAWTAVTIVYALSLYAIKKFNLMISLLFKQAIIIAVVMSAGIYVLASLTQNMLISDYKESIIMTMRQTVYKTANKIDTERFFAIDWTSPQDSKYYFWLRDEFSYESVESQILINSRGTDESKILLENLFIELMYLDNGQIYTAVYDNEFVGTPLKLIESKETITNYERLINDKNYDGYLNGFENEGEWMTLTVPLYSNSNQVIGLIECGISMRQFELHSEQSARKIFIFAALLTVALLIIMTLGLGFPMRYLKKLRVAVDGIGGENYKLSLSVSGNDEIAKISGALNEMSERICHHTNELQEINMAYHRFLPSEILQKLQKESIMNVGCGDNTTIDAVILYVAVHGFDIIMGEKDADFAFDVFNLICADIMISTADNGGITESCNQSGFICLFDSESAAYTAALDIKKKLDMRGGLAVSINFALVKGKALIGIAGNDRRLCTFTVSKSVKLVKTLADEGLYYGASIVCGDGFGDIHFSRYLGKLSFEKEYIKLYDCYEGDEIEVMQSKNKLSKLFAKGVELFEKAEWRQSKLVFIEYLKQSVPDVAARRYLFMCEDNLSALD